MTVAAIITFLYVIGCWLIFFRFRLIKFSIVWGVVTFWVGVHLLLVFLIGVRFYTPYSTDGHVIRQTIQLIPRLPQPTLLVDVLFEQNQPVKKGDVLYQFDKTLYEAQLREKEGRLATAQQNAQVLQENISIASDAVNAAQAAQTYADQQVKRYTDLASGGGARQETLDQWVEQLAAANAQLSEAQGNLSKAQLAAAAQVNGVYAEVVEAQARVDQASYFVDQTTLRAPADGVVVSQQARPGLVTGELRIGAIAALVTDDNPYFLATFYQEHLKLVTPGQEAEVTLDILPGQIFKAKVTAIWDATGQGQLVPSGDIPKFLLPHPQGRFAVQFDVYDPALPRFPAGAHGAVAIYTGGGGIFQVIRRVNIRLYSFMNFLFPLDI
jgi:multidrug resistance efflux pump